MIIFNFIFFDEENYELFKNSNAKIFGKNLRELYILSEQIHVL